MGHLVSVIMPTFNSISTVRESIDSVRRQSYAPWELLITDDCSTDGTYEVLLEIASIDSRIKVYRNENNLGAGVSRNNSINQASGRFIAFLDSDDLWHKDKLSKQIDFMLQGKYALTYTYYRKIDASGNLKGGVHPPKKVNYRTLLKSNVIGCLTAIYDRELLNKQFMPAIRKRQDMALWLTILQRIDYAMCLPEELAFYREGHISLSSNKLKILSSQWDFYKNYLGFSNLKSLYYFFFYALNAVKKHGLVK
ncbi:glycosyltransferase family 2 protein [Kosakonia cowanii]